jgi:hypothetical protein
MSDDQPFYVTQNEALSRAEPKDDLLHPERNAKVASLTLTETQYFGFCIPEERIEGFCYMYHHPKLQVVSGGILAWRGHTRSVVHGELSDIRTFMSDAALKNDLHEYRLDNGYGVKVVEPLKRHHVTYADPARNNSADLHFEAICAPVMFGDGNHFEQPMKVRGELVLRGQRYAVNCYTTRDRSWAKPRPEDNMALPPNSWTVGVFNDNFAFSCNMFDQVATTPQLHGSPLAVAHEKSLNGGWLWRDGKLGRFVRGNKRILRDRDSRIPQYLEFDATDEHDRTIHVRGTAIASTAWHPWSNIFMPIVLMRWECEGLTTHGDCQEGIWNDFLNLPG